MEKDGVTHRWLRAEAAPGESGEPLWARVIEPTGVHNPPTLVFLHGISMETDFWAGFEDAAMMAVGQGFRLVRAEGPGHGRRRAKGEFGGEQVMATAPLGFISYISRHVREAGRLIAWARGQSSGPVGLAGVSLGGLTAQKLACASRNWPEAYRPDALMLIVVSGHVSGLDMGGRLAGEMEIGARLRAAGWSDDLVKPYAALVEPARSAPLPAKRIFMLLAEQDEIMPIAEGRALARDWGLPAGNLTVRKQGHFTAYLGLPAAPEPLLHFLARVKAL
jgi:pimeloyl-ACP methyl ester carboxylesterase